MSNLDDLRTEAHDSLHVLMIEAQHDPATMTLLKDVAAYIERLEDGRDDFALPKLNVKTEPITGNIARTVKCQLSDIEVDE